MINEDQASLVRPRQPVEVYAVQVALQGVLGSLNVGVGIALEDDLLIEVNPALLILLGREPSDVLGRSLDALLPAAGHQTERTFRRRDGRVCWVRVGRSVVPARDGRPLLHVTSLEDITDLKRRELALHERALRDPVTGLANRYLLEDRLEHALATRRRTGRELSVVFVDLNGFKVVNDTLGHRAGDAVLREAGRRIASSARAADTVARWAGDEFVVLCEGVTIPPDAERIAARIVAACAAPFTVAEGSVALTASVGLATTGPGVEDAGTLLDRADAAMYAHKQSRPD